MEDGWAWDVIEDSYFWGLLLHQQKISSGRYSYNYNQNNCWGYRYWDITEDCQLLKDCCSAFNKKESANIIITMVVINSFILLWFIFRFFFLEHRGKQHDVKLYPSSCLKETFWVKFGMHVTIVELSRAWVLLSMYFLFFLLLFIHVFIDLPIF